MAAMRELFAIFILVITVGFHFFLSSRRDLSKKNDLGTDSTDATTTILPWHQSTPVVANE